MYFFNILRFNNYFFFNLNLLKSELLNRLLINVSFINNFYILNELIWQEGLLIDFLQKKIADNWIKKFLIRSSYLFSERLVFDKIIKFYLNLLILPFHKISIFEFNNVSNILFITVFFFSSFFIIFFFFYFLILMF